MPEILIRGKKKERTLTAKCDNCDSLIRFKENEIVTIFNQGSPLYGRGECPVCWHPIIANFDN